MNDHGKILNELRDSLADAQRRAEERMSHVQRQLAAWTAPGPVNRSLSDADPKWEQLQTQADVATEEVDQELAAVQGSLAELVQQGRKWKTATAK